VIANVLRAVSVSLLLAITHWHLANGTVHMFGQLLQGLIWQFVGHQKHLEIMVTEYKLKLMFMSQQATTTFFYTKSTPDLCFVNNHQSRVR